MKNNIKNLRNEKGISQQKLAENLGVSRQTINSIEKGRFDPSLKLTIKITRFFKKHLEEVFIMSVRDAISATPLRPPKWRGDEQGYHYQGICQTVQPHNLRSPPGGVARPDCASDLSSWPAVQHHGRR